MPLDGRDVAQLNNHQLRKVMNTLLTVEANENRVPLVDLELNTRDTDPDAGIDARVLWPASAPNDHLAAGENVLQYKAGKLALANIATELSKPGVMKTLRAHGSYLLLVGHDYVLTTRDKHQKELARLCRKKRVPISRCRILYGDQIARWASRHLAIPILPEFNKPLRGFGTIEQLKHDHLFQNQYLADAIRQTIIAAVRNFVSSPGQENVLRIEGPAGVGKSRLVLEALSERGFAEAALYAADAEGPQVQDFLAWVQADACAHGIIVVDECTLDRQEVLMRLARLAGPRRKARLCWACRDYFSDALWADAGLPSASTCRWRYCADFGYGGRSVPAGGREHDCPSFRWLCKIGAFRSANPSSSTMSTLVELRHNWRRPSDPKKFVPIGTAKTLEALCCSRASGAGRTKLEVKPKLWPLR